ncbi:hypothetical protein [Alloactinosynnema sp. L-07]|uniref:hypothetical protein n=1 Tax=Alloactinosynnema sp. L-07 TaxID=1653480 RepID=UPI00065EF39A|nr:hypothetical protein [Alloactinosynnema sp. L-07]CRK57061.1 hypothetical protein [Alloactinosynnema sp. L-07]
MGSNQHVTQLARQVNRLFEVAKRPDGRKWTNSDLADHITSQTGSACSRQWVGQIRKGAAVEVLASRLEAIASFFKVPVGYFTDSDRAKVIDAEIELAVVLGKLGLVNGLAELEVKGLHLRQLTELHPDDVPLVTSMLQTLIEQRRQRAANDSG